MATLIRTSGLQETVTPLNGTTFTLEEMQTLVGGYIQMIWTHDCLIGMVDEDGKLKGKPINHVATTHYRYGSHDPLVGEVLVGTPLEMGMND
jgi:hypothetical protein